MPYQYSRRIRTEEKKNIRKARLFIFLTILLLALFFVFGIPSIAKFAAFLTEIRRTNTKIEVSDNTPPPPPRFEPLPEFTKEDKVEISGQTEAGAIVKLFVNNKEAEVIANNQGHFNYTFTLNDRENTLQAKSVDQAGNESSDSDKITVFLDKDAPTLTINKPEDGSQFYGANERQIVIEGISEEDAAVNINSRMVVVENDGSFSLYTTLSEGENSFSIKTRDKAGNETEKTLKVTFNP